MKHKQGKQKKIIHYAICQKKNKTLIIFDVGKFYLLTHKRYITEN